MEVLLGAYFQCGVHVFLNFKGEYALAKGLFNGRRYWKGVVLRQGYQIYWSDVFQGWVIHGDEGYSALARVDSPYPPGRDPAKFNWTMFTSDELFFPDCEAEFYYDCSGKSVSFRKFAPCYSCPPSVTPPLVTPDPTPAPTTPAPTDVTDAPSNAPSNSPTRVPSNAPSVAPSDAPSSFVSFLFLTWSFRMGIVFRCADSRLRRI